jgi:galactokinase/mevalonate kinase-like predicted kinase
MSRWGRKWVCGKLTSGSGWVVVVSVERGDQCGHFGGKFMCGCGSGGWVAVEFKKKKKKKMEKKKKKNIAKTDIHKNKKIKIEPH